MLSQVTSGVHVRLRWPMVAAVVFMHAVALGALTEVTRSGRDPHGVQHTPPVITGFIIEERPTRDTVEIPEAFFERPNVQLQTITQVQFESGGWGDISQVVAPSSAPQLSRFQPVDPASFARRAGLTAGQVASVLLTVEVLPNGRTGTVEVLRGFGNAMVDAAAVAYARQLRWTPGTQNYHAQPMRINLPVVLVWNA